MFLLVSSFVIFKYFKLNTILTVVNYDEHLDYGKLLENRHILGVPPDIAKPDRSDGNEEMLNEFPLYIFGYLVNCDSGINFSLRWSNNEQKSRDLPFD